MPVTIRGKEIRISFSYNPATLNVVKELPDRTWDRTDRVWTVPATAWHARQVLDKLGKLLPVDRTVSLLATKDQRTWDDSTLDLSVGGLTPYPYQAGAVEFLQAVGGRAIIADEVGLGKTIEAIAYARKEGLTRILIVCPASVLYKWGAEVARWYPEVVGAVQVVDSSDPITGQVLVISYDRLIRRLNDVSGRIFDLLICDEVHRLKNPKTQRFLAVKALAPGIPRIVGMSGTPILNRPRELYNILNILDPRAWKWFPFFNYYCGGKEHNYNGAFHLEELEERLRGVMLRRFKRDVSNQLPPFRRTVVPLVLNPEAMRNYRALLERDTKIIAHLFPHGKGYFVNDLDWLNAMRQFLEVARAEAVAEWAEDFLDSSTRETKLVIYCGFKRTLALISDRLHPYGVQAITGDVSNAERQRIIDRWQNTYKDRVMLITSAGGEGIDLFGRGEVNCSTIVFAGREWSPAVEEQIEGRLDRTGQAYPVEAVYLVAQSTIDEDIYQLIEAKRRMLRSAVRLADVPTDIVGDLLSVLRSRGVIS